MTDYPDPGPWQDVYAMYETKSYGISSIVTNSPMRSTVSQSLQEKGGKEGTRDA